MRVCFTSDFHGHMALYEQLASLLRAERPELLILGGDMNAEATIEDPLGTQVAFIRNDLAGMIDAWKAALPGLTVFSVLGNHDLACAEAALRDQHEAGRLILLDHHRPCEHGGLRWLGFSPTPPSPYWVKDFERLDRRDDEIPAFDGAFWDPQTRVCREITAVEHFTNKPTLADELSTAAATEAPWIFVCHPPPHASKLDRLPSVPHPIGSRAVRKFIEERQPLCSLHGHVHESPEVTGSYVDRIGQTYCINPGQSHDRLQAVLFDTDDFANTLRHTVFG